jgi:hypothetical protein
VGDGKQVGGLIISQTEMLLGIPDPNLQMEPKGVDRNDLPGTQSQICRKQAHRIAWGLYHHHANLLRVDAVQKFFDTQRADENSTLNQISEKYFGMSLIDYIGLVTKIE